MSAQVLPPLVVNSKSKRKINSLPPLGFELVIIGMLAHLSNHSAKSHPIAFWLTAGGERVKQKIAKDPDHLTQFDFIPLDCVLAACVDEYFLRTGEACVDLVTVHHLKSSVEDLCKVTLGQKACQKTCGCPGYTCL
jgi:hypothetical protein